MKKLFIALILLCLTTAAAAVLYRFNFIPHAYYDSAHFGITPYTSAYDADGDGIDDQTDILLSAREYIATKPKYKSEYYEGGYPDDGFGVCTDVTAFAMRGAGYDLMRLVSDDIAARPDAYDIDRPDENIDFRRVRNLLVYFNHNALSLTTDINEISEWQGGDIVVFNEHIGIVSDRRNRDGVPFLIHHAYPGQPRLEEDVLGRYGTVLGHFRIS